MLLLQFFLFCETQEEMFLKEFRKNDSNHFICILQFQQNYYFTNNDHSQERSSDNISKHFVLLEKSKNGRF